MEVPCYKQKKNYTCAVCCLRMISGYYGKMYEEIENEMPVIVYLRTKYLPWWEYDAIHAVVVAGIDETYIYLNEPWTGSKVRCEISDFIDA